MVVFDSFDRCGALHHFEVSCFFLSRKRAVRLVASVTGAAIRKLAWRQDTFCEFAIDGVVLELWEPWGDSSRFHVGSTPPGAAAQLARARDVFARAPTLAIFGRWA